MRQEPAIMACNLHIRDIFIQRTQEVYGFRLRGGIGMKTTTTMLALLLFLSGCSNDSAFEGISSDSGRDAVIEEAAIALDSRDYATTIQILTEIYTATSPDPRVSRLLSSAYMGRAGVDFVELIEYSGQGEREDFDMVAESLALSWAPKLDNDESQCDAETGAVLTSLDESDSNYDVYKTAQFIDGHCIGYLIENLEQAQYILKILVEGDLHSLDDEIQLGVASAAHFIFVTGNAVADGMNYSLSLKPEDRKPGTIPVPINMQAYLYYINFSGGIRYDWSRLNEGDFGVEADDPQSLNPYQKDLIDIYRAVQAFFRATPEQNRVRDSLGNFLAFAMQRPIDEIDVNLITSTMTTAGVYNLVNSFSAE